MVMSVETVTQKTSRGQVQVSNRRRFLTLSPVQRREILEKQAKLARSYYEQSTEWREWERANLMSGADE
jgi:hypothetical protein